MLLIGPYDIIHDSAKTVGQLQFRIQPVSDGKIADMKEAVAQVSRSSVAPPPAAAQLLGNLVEHAESVAEQASDFSDTINDICGKLEFLQGLGDKISEVGYYIVRSMSIDIF